MTQSLLPIKIGLSALVMTVLKDYVKMHNTEIVVLNNIETSPTQKMIDGMISIVHVFSYRLYGLCKYKSKLKNE